MLDTDHGAAPHRLFSQTAEQRLALARQRFFEEGERPSGVVSESVFQSWLRCMAARRDPAWMPVFDAVTRSRVHTVLNRSRELLGAARPDLDTLEASVAGMDCRVILTDGEGVVVHATALSPLPYQPALNLARVGVDLDERRVGTTAPGLVAREGQAVTVIGAEHFYTPLGAVECAAAPIRDVHGRLAGVLDLSIEGRHFSFHPAAMVGLFAVRIENRLLRAQSREHLVLQFQADPSLLGTPVEGLAGIDGQGRVCWLNRVATQLVGEPGLPADITAIFGLDLSTLLALTRQVSPLFHQLPGGPGMWLCARLQARDGLDASQALTLAPRAAVSCLTSVPVTCEVSRPAAKLQEHSRQLIESTLQACDGNISRAARQLGVSRGLLYRRLRDDPLFHLETGKSRA